jgi:hypothetical protein
MRRNGGFQFVLGVAVGAVLFGGAAAYAADIIAQPKTAAVVIDGQAVNLQGYVIGGNHYFQLRDTSAALKAGGKDFSIVWDGAGGRILIDTSRGYNANEGIATTRPNPEQDTAGAPETGGYGTVYAPLKAGTTVKTEPSADSKGSVGGDYFIEKGPEDSPWKTSEGLTWPNVPLPEWQSEWDTYPRVEIPERPPVRFTGEVYGHAYDTLMILNRYEIERMIRTIYKYAKQNPSLWKDHDPSGNVPNFTIKVEFTDDMSYNTFYPWRDFEIEKFVKSTGGGTEFRIYAYDNYNLGRFVDTEYFMK